MDENERFENPEDNSERFYMVKVWVNGPDNEDDHIEEIDRRLRAAGVEYKHYTGSY